MSDFSTQALHNESFHSSICQSFPKYFFDWKITVTFYCALHYLKALAEQRNIAIGESHGDIRSNVRPARYPGNNPAMAIKSNAYDWYDLLYESSRASRYFGFTDPETFQEIMQEDHKICQDAFEKFKKYIIGQGLNIPDEEAESIKQAFMASQVADDHLGPASRDPQQAI